MGETSESRRKSRAMTELSLELHKYPRDLLQRFSSSSETTQQSRTYVTPNEETEELELNLGLSLGGRFGVDKTPKKLTRSSSIVGTLPIVRDNYNSGNNSSNDATALPRVSCHGLMRTASLPTETEEEWRKRKEMQTLRRMEAKRRRSEKQQQKNRESAAAAAAGGEDDRREFEGLNLSDKHRSMAGGSRCGPGAPFGLPSWTARRCGGQPSSQGSVESQGGSSSGMSESECKPAQGSSSYGETRSPVGDLSNQDRMSQKALAPTGTKSNEELENKSRQPDCTVNRGKEVGLDALADMPCVFTKGDGPNGGRVDGILYKYGKGEEVRIMCICHGSFHSPAEFVKHAGGGDVDHPLRHIVINPNATPFS